MKTIIKTTILLTCVITVSFCATISTNEKREGLIDGTLFRVYVKIDSLEIKDTMTDSDVNKLLIDKGIKRFQVIWRGIISKNGNIISKETYESVNNSINNSAIYYRKEKEDYAEAYIDFKIEKSVKEYYEKLYPPLTSDQEDDDETK